MQRKYGFTLIEVVVVLLVIGTALSTIIASISGTIGYLSAIKQRTIAMSMAREGIEAIYSIRNTNWRRWSSQKDDCRLNIDPLGSSDCSTTFSEGAIGVVVPVFSGEKTPTQNVSDQNTYHRFEPNNVEEIKQKLSQKDIDQDTSIYRVVEEK